MNSRFDYAILDAIQNAIKTVKASPLILGGVAGSGGGAGGPVGGVVGYLPQTRVSYDLSEIASSGIPESGMSLLDNLNHIRYRLQAVEASGAFGSGAANFLQLLDTPDAYTGSTGKAVVVNATETGLEFALISGGGGGISDAPADNIYYGRRNNVWTNLKTYFDTLYSVLSHTHSGIYAALTHTHNHNDTTSIQGGTANEYYHLTFNDASEATTFFNGGINTHTQIDDGLLTANQKIDLTDGGSTTLHTHSGLVGGSGINEAPIDGFTYGRQNAEWVVFSGIVPTEAIVLGVDGALAVIGSATVPYLVTNPVTVSAWYIALETLGTSSSTIIDINKNGSSIFASGDRPTLLFNDANGWAKSGPPQVTTFIEGDIITLDIDQVAPGAVRLSAAGAINSAGVGGGGAGGSYDYVLVERQATNDTEGGTAVNASWETLHMNTEVWDTANICSVASYQITLAAGTYDCAITSLFFNTLATSLRLRNITDGSTALMGVTGYNGNGFQVHINGRFIITAQKTFEVQYYCENAQADYGLGPSVGFRTGGYTDTEVYTSAEFKRVG